MPILATALCALQLGGCGMPGQGGEAGDPGMQRVSVLEGREVYDLLNQPWQDDQEMVSAEIPWNHNAYQENLVQDPPDLSTGVKYRAVEGKDYYILAVYTIYAQEDGEKLHYLNHIDGDTLEAENRLLHLEELEDGPFIVNSIDVSGGSPVLFLYKYDLEQTLLTDYCAVWFDGEGHVESRLDLMPALQEAGLVAQGGYLTSDTGKWDSQGYYCVRGVGEEYAIIDREGKLATVLDPIQDMESAIVNLYHDGQGRCIWETSCAAWQCNIFWGIREGRQASLYRGKYQVVKNRLFNTYGDMYYIDGRDNLVRWDLSTGKCEKLYEGNAGTFGDCYASAQDSTGNILLFYDNGSMDYLFRIANEDVEQVELTLASYGADTQGIRMFVEEYNRLHPNVKIVIQSGTEGEQDSQWIRIQADMAAGKGPDLLVADREQMAVLQEKGVLADLSQVLSQETQEALFPGALEYGPINGGLYTI
ncbi:MAG: extracellular solute-binding protein [Acetatifactor sp.]|nr:extracellular solute-binding protein [Acetatifactor sp.]